MEKNILITGSNGGVGHAIAEHLLNSGKRNLILHYRTGSERIAELLRKHDIDIGRHLFQADLTNEEDLRNMNAKINEQHGPVSSLINVAGMSTNAMSWKMTKSDFSNVIDNNLTSTFLCSREFIPQMRANNWGRIINFSSVVASMGVVGASHYCAAKSGIEGFSKSLSLELSNKNITVNSIALGYFEFGLIKDVPEEMQTKIKAQIPLSRFGTGNEVGNTVKFLLDSNSSYLTGQVIHLNGGLR